MLGGNAIGEIRSHQETSKTVANASAKISLLAKKLIFLKRKRYFEIEKYKKMKRR